MGCQSRLDPKRWTIHPGTILWAAAAVACLTGCRTGSSWGGPSWSMFGSGTKNDTLASAPPFEGDVAKPSTTAKPYPTTSSPEGYALEHAAGQPAAPSLPAEAASPTAVVYGSTPPAGATTAASPAAVPPNADGGPGYGAATAAGLPSPISSIVPQVGPYAATTPSPAAAEPPVGAGEPYAAAAPPTGPGAGIPPARVADARTATSWSAERSTGQTAGSTAARYEAGSRFSSSAGTDAVGAAGWSTPGGQSLPESPPASVPQAAAETGLQPAAPASRYSQARGPQAEGVQPGYSQPGSPQAGYPQTNDPQAGYPEAGFPPVGANTTGVFGGASPTPPAAFSVPPGNEPVAMPQTAPGQVPGAGQALPLPPQTGSGPAVPGPAGTVVPGQPPVRRADPVYRPGGTSSYQRADDAAAGVLPASFNGVPAQLP